MVVQVSIQIKKKYAEGLLGFAFRQSFLAHLIGAFGNFVVNLFYFEREPMVIGTLRVFLEQCVSFCAQVVALFLPNIRGWMAHATSVDPLLND